MGTSFCVNFAALSGDHLSKLRNPLIAELADEIGVTTRSIEGNLKALQEKVT